MTLLFKALARAWSIFKRFWILVALIRRANGKLTGLFLIVTVGCAATAVAKIRARVDHFIATKERATRLGLRELEVVAYVLCLLIYGDQKALLASAWQSEAHA